MPQPRQAQDGQDRVGLRGGLPSGRIESYADRLKLDLSARLRDLSHGNKRKAGLIQAFIFAVLTASYIGTAMSEDH